LEGEKGRKLKLESFLLPLFCVIFGKKSQGKWIKKERFQSIPKKSVSDFFRDSKAVWKN